MPRGRAKKSAATNGSGEEPAAKKAKVELQSDKWRWEWEDDKIKKWVQYNQEVSDALCDAVTNNHAEILLDIGSNMVMRVIVDKMVQKNKATGWEKRIRCCRKEGDDYFVWEWEDEHSTWSPYSVEHQMALWNSKGDDVTLNIVGRNYEIDKAGLTQTNTDTGVSRTIRKAQSVANAAVSGKTKILPPPAPAPSAAAAAAAPPPPPKSGRKGRVAKSGASGDKIKEEEEEEVVPKKSAAAKKKSGRQERDPVRTVIVKGRAPVDPECVSKINVAHVYEEGNDIYDVMLNQTNLQNNNNKFFIIQLLEDDAKKSYSVWFRWGRVGYSGQNSLQACGPSLDEAKKLFCKKFSDKTKNNWAERNSFEKVAGKYDLVAIDYGKKDAAKVEDVVDGPSKSGSIPVSKLDNRLQDLINLICDVKTMEDAVIEMKYDARKAPLGKLTSQQVKAGYAALKTIDNCIRKNDFGARLTEACNDFYTRIPHDFGFQRPPTIRSVQEVKLKVSLLEALADIEIAMKLLKQGSADENPVDSHYKSLECGLEPLDNNDADFKMIEDYVKNTHASTHSNYKMKVLDVFSTKKAKYEKTFVDHGNRMLLWHGSRLTNWMGILSQGLRIAPPEAPVTGYMFGKGVYFADMSSKSANYCYPSKTKNVGLLLLCEVSLGSQNELLAADYAADKLPAGKHSVKGMGKTAPDPKNNFTTPDGMVVPLGKGKDTGVTNNSLLYNEFIVYDTKQIKMRYLVKVRFDYR